MSLNMKRQMQSPVSGTDWFPAMLQAGDWLAGLLLCGKGPGGPGGHYAKHESAGL